MTEIDRASNLILLLESRLSHSGLGSWGLNWRIEPGRGYFHQHHGLCNFLFIDQHLKSLRLAQTCVEKMWSDQFPDKSEVCRSLDLAEEYQ